jgi:NADH-quinone oxidoreductase subunit L
MLAQGILYVGVSLALIAPLIAALIVSLTFFVKKPLAYFEKITYRLVRFFYLFGLCCSILALSAWGLVQLSHASLHFGQFRLMKNFIVNLRLVFDLYSLVFLVTCTFITALITFFSHRYLHRDPGYRRFFITISLLAFGINLIILAGAFDLIFMGWEIVGLSSFLLIGYFWHRPKAIAAACRAYYIYRITDLGLLIGLLITHFFWHDVSIFIDFFNTNSHSILSHVPSGWRWLLSMCILLPVLGKSAQFPLCFWLPKAMEGPTHSSAIFYGSLSIHVGVFLLLRTRPIWYFTPGFTYLLLAIGLITAVSATLFALVQSNIKGQIGYASIAQVGLMLVELSLGLTTVVFIHMIGNAFLRCFQLLVSGSILTTHLHMQNVVRTFGEWRMFSLPNLFPKKIRPSLYVFAINDGFFELILKKIFVKPIMFLANSCNLILTGNIANLFNNLQRLSKSPFAPKANITLRSFSPMFALLCCAVIIDLFFRSYEIIRMFSLITALILILASLGESKKPINALLLVIFGNLFAFLSIFSSTPGLLYLIGLLTSSLIAVEALRYINSRRTIPDLKSHQGLFQQFPLAGTVFLVGILGVVSFPLSSTFYGEDILLELSIDLGLHYLIMFQIIFIMSGISVIRLYSLIMLGIRDNFIKDIDLDFTPLAAFLRFSLLILGNTLAFAVVMS